MSKSVLKMTDCENEVFFCYSSIKEKQFRGGM